MKNSGCHAWCMRDREIHSKTTDYSGLKTDVPCKMKTTTNQNLNKVRWYKDKDNIDQTYKDKNLFLYYF